MSEEFKYTGHEELDQQQHLPRYNRHIASLFSKAVQPGSHLLDFGAGIGTISSLVRNMVHPESITCIEIDPQNIAELKQKGFCVITDAAECPLGSIDVVYSSNVLEHIEDDVGVLRKLHACLKPGGCAVFWVPALECLWTKMDERVQHHRRYTREGLEQAFKDAGFAIEKSMYQDSLGFVVTLLFKVIGSKDGTVSTMALKIYDTVIFPASRLCDVFFRPFFGKNAVIYARKD